MSSPSRRRSRLAVATGATSEATTATPSTRRLHDDFNGDGYPDLAIGAPGTAPDGETRAGAISVLYGSSGGLSTSRKQVLNRPGDEYNGGYGTQLQSADVSTGVPGEDFDGLSNAGGVVVLLGGANGLTGTRATGVNQDTAGVPGAAETDDAFGRTTRLVDADHDGLAELVVGAPGENANAGSVWVFRSTSAGITPTGSFTFGAGTLGTVAANAKLGSAFNS